MSIEKLNLFPTQVYKFKCTNHDKIKDHLMKFVYPKFKEKGPNGGAQSIFTDYIPNSGAMVNWNFMHKLYEPDIKNILTEIGFDFNVWEMRQRSWYNFSTDNTEEWKHDHVGGSSTINWSYVHYVHLEEENAGTIFFNPDAKNLRAFCPTKDLAYLPNMYLYEREQPQVEEGDILLFPSWLEHSSPAHQENRLRISVACNIMLKTPNDTDGY
jgi:hypothetical protein